MCFIYGMQGIPINDFPQVEIYIYNIYICLCHICIVYVHVLKEVMSLCGELMARHVNQNMLKSSRKNVAEKMLEIFIQQKKTCESQQ